MKQYRVLLRKVAQKQLDDTSGKDNEVIQKTLHSLAENPRPFKLKKLTGSELWRVRVGHFRIIFAINDDAETITAVRITRRNEDTYNIG